MKTSSIVALLGGGLLLLGAGWWLLREESREAAGEIAALQAAGDDGAARAPGFAAPPLDESAAPGDAAAAGLPHEARVSSLEATRAPDDGIAPLDLRVTHAGGAPATGAVVVVGRDGKVLCKGITDREGRVRVTPPAGDEGGAADVLIGGVSDRPVLRRLQSIVGEQTIALADGAVVEGLVLVDGAPPQQPLPLALAPAYAADDPDNDAKHDALWNALRVSWPGSSDCADVNSQIVGADGRFRFSGLPDKAWRFLGASDAYAWEADANAASAATADGFPAASEGADDPDRPSLEDDPFVAGRLVRTPATGLVLRLHATKRFTGRIVEAQGGAPVPFASLSFSQRRASGTSQGSSLRCDANGRFLIALTAAREPIVALALDIRHPEGRGSRTLQLDAEDCATGKDFGDIALDPTRTVHLLVRDESGAPISGAVGVSDDERAQRSPPTGRDGRTEWYVLPFTTSITVWAARCYAQAATLPPVDAAHVPTTSASTPTATTRTVNTMSAGATAAGTTQAVPHAGASGSDAAVASAPPAPPPPIDELVVVLRRSPSLDVTVVRADGSSAEELRVTLSCTQQLFESAGRSLGDAGFAPGGMVISLGMSTSSWRAIPKEGGTAAQASGSMTFLVSDEDSIRVRDLLPDVPFELRVHDRYGGLVSEPQTLRLAAGEQRELRIVVSSAPRDLVLRVTDPQGAPLQASVENHISAIGIVRGYSTKADGRVTLPGVEGRDITLIVRSKGFADATLEHVAAPPDGTPLDVVLSPGRQVRVHVTDAHGKDLTVERVSARDERQRIVGRCLLDEPGAAAQLAAPGVFADRLVARASDSVASAPEDRSRWLLVELPPEAISVEARVGGETFSAPCGATQGQVEIVAPARGTAHVHWEQPLGTIGLQIVLRRTGDGAAATVRRSPSVEEFLARDLLIPGLAPGTWEVRMLATNEDGTTTLLAGPATASVTADATTGVLLVAK